MRKGRALGCKAEKENADTMQENLTKRREDPATRMKASAPRPYSWLRIAGHSSKWRWEGTQRPVAQCNAAAPAAAAGTELEECCRSGGQRGRGAERSLKNRKKAGLGKPLPLLAFQVAWSAAADPELSLHDSGTASLVREEPCSSWARAYHLIGCVCLGRGTCPLWDQCPPSSTWASATLNFNQATGKKT